ncbi:MAG: HD domain-containing phosphohydrolase, partial [Vicinamibacterales bacterium]
IGIDRDLELKALEAAALLHDMGKVAVPDHILNTPGRLTPAEYEKMKLHAVIGADILSAVEFPFPVVPIVRHHHENWDGTGYPDGLEGEGIPIGARILSVIDCYDALTSDRPYRRALTRDQAMAIIHERRGNMYDPAIVDAFDRIVDRLPVIDAGDRLRTDALDRISKMVSEPPEKEGRHRALTDSTFAERILQLCDLSEVMADHATLEDVANVLGRHLQRMIPASLVVFYLRNHERDVLTAAHAVGTGEELVAGLELPLGDGLSGWVAVNGTSIRNSPPALDFGNRLAPLAVQPHSALSTKLVGPDGVIGVVTLYSPTSAAFSLDHQHVLELVARPIAAALARARRFDTERASNLTDAETGLPNERYLAQLLTTRGFSDSLLMYSLGILALEWDTHASSPDQLRRLAEAVRKAVRVTDLTFRHGEQRLVVLIPDCDSETGTAVSERVTMAVAAALGSRNVVHTGFASAPADGDTLTELVQAAQSRLQRQRNGGALMVVAHHPPDSGDASGAPRAIPA